MRTERKKYGTEKIIEDHYVKGERVVLLDEAIEKGIVKRQVIGNIQGEGLVVTDAVVLVNHPRGGKEELQKMGIQVHHWTDIKEITEILKDETRYQIYNIRQ